MRRRSSERPEHPKIRLVSSHENGYGCFMTLEAPDHLEKVRYSWGPERHLVRENLLAWAQLSRGPAT